MPMMCGGIGAPQPANEEIQKLVDSLKGSAEAIAGKTFDVFVAKTYSTQCVAGTIYYIKVHVGGEEHINLRVHKPLACTGEATYLDSIQEYKSRDDPVVHLQVKSNYAVKQ
ncbi:cystatin-B-like [Cheilinus undulatus]|uniref:cystatin-B-like n=1 Tax=Cheilinus undulatus TaxID=241271 RepID=UPI001BD29BDE|nr:cystatin-B-like [Cheilinus undulatus]XP_041670366.1 cystatin-B-like [Cheilinus undulatus]